MHGEEVRYDYEQERLVGEELKVFIPEYREQSATLSPGPGSSILISGQVDPGLNVLFNSSGNHHQDYRISNISTEQAGRDVLDPAMTETSTDKQPAAEAKLERPGPPKTELSTGSDGTTVTTDSAIDLRGDRSPKKTDAAEQTDPASVALAARPRPATPATYDANIASQPRIARAALASPLHLQTSHVDERSPSKHDGDSIARSPILSKHTLAQTEDQGDNLPPLEPTSPSASSPQAERLPSFRQLAGSLTDLAEAATAATQEITRQQQPYSHHHSKSFGSATSQSPVMSNHPYPAHMQTSPQAYYAPSLSARSPTSTIAETANYGSPSGYPPYGFFAHRRHSAVGDGPPHMPPSMPSASSSGESHGYGASPGMDSYTTNQTTPVNHAQAPDGTPRAPPAHTLPIPPGMQPAPIMIPGPYTCDVQGCQAGTFQTQYLLNSHRNVHSQSRPHYCPIAGCPRSESGRGFKRKNEMIRHGLVHKSPGYICPFCPEREHRYPRPDNLQRHVRVHHPDVSKEDQQLREVLEQRLDGQGKTRRRRTNTGG